MACRRGLTEVVKLLISKGASVDVEDCVSKLNTFLVRKETASLFLILLKNGFVPLGYAIDGGHSDIAVGLINAGAMKQMADAVMFFSQLVCNLKFKKIFLIHRERRIFFIKLVLWVSLL